MNLLGLRAILALALAFSMLLPTGTPFVATQGLTVTTNLSTYLVGVGERVNVSVQVSFQGASVSDAAVSLWEEYTVQPAGPAPIGASPYNVTTVFDNETTDSSGRAVLTYSDTFLTGTTPLNVGCYALQTTATTTVMVEVVDFTTSLALTAPATATMGNGSIMVAALNDSLGPVSWATLSFFANDIWIGNATTGNSGMASMEFTPNATGPLAVRAAYAGEGYLFGQSSNQGTINVVSPGVQTSQLELLALVVVILVALLMVAFRLRGRTDKGGN